MMIILQHMTTTAFFERTFRHHWSHFELIGHKENNKSRPACNGQDNEKECRLLFSSYGGRAKLS